MQESKQRLWATLGALAVVIGCSESAEDAAGRRDYAIELEAGHTHVYKTYDVTFAVVDKSQCEDPADTTTCAGVAGLPLRIFSEPFGEARVTQALAPDVLVDNGDGTYTWTAWFAWLLPYVVGVEFEKDGHGYAEVFPYETAKAGGEMIFCPALPDPVPEGWIPSYNYQVRWHANPGHIVADGETKVSFDIELRRSRDTANVAQPWRNSFDHLLPENLEVPVGGSDADKLTVQILDRDAPDAALATYRFGTSEADVKYVGLGIYRVSHVFAPETVGNGAFKKFMLRVSFDDDAMHEGAECPVVDEFDEGDHDDYTFPVYRP